MQDNKTEVAGGAGGEAAISSAAGAPMRLLNATVYRGPHLYSDRPMIRLQVDLGRLEAWPTDTVPGFNDRLIALLPGLGDHGCSYHQPGGLLRRLEDGTWMGHVAEHVALELQTLAGHKATRGKTRSVKGRPGVYNILYVYEDEAVGLEAGRAALRLVDSLLPDALRGLAGVAGADQPFDLNQALSALKALARRSNLGPTTASLVREARRRGIPVARLNEQSLIRLGWGARQKLIRASITAHTSLIAAEAAGDKALAKALMSAASVPSPRGVVVRTAQEAVAASKGLKTPLVTKPLDGNHGRGVTLGLETQAAIEQGFSAAVQHGRRVILEEQYRGQDYRILVVDGQVVAVAERLPAQVTGDGTRNIGQLIEATNADPRRGRGHETVMTRIAVDEALHQRLARDGLGLESVPSKGERVQLCDAANLSTGGEAIDRTDVIHPDNAAIARRAARALGLDVAGIDFISPDITRSAHEVGGGVVEVNAAPGFRMHLEPSQGQGRNVAAPVIDMLFPRRRSARMPLVAITGTNGKSTVVRMVARIFTKQGWLTGMTTTTGVYVGDEQVYAGDASGPKSARLVLADPTVEAAVLETARGGILREGLGFDRCDVGCVLNITADHLGIKGVDTLADLAAVKSVVTESVRRGGLSVLNADDPLTLGMARHAGGRVAYFSMQGGEGMSPFLQKHIAAGGVAATLEPGGQLVLHRDGASNAVMKAEAIPATLQGLAGFNIANALAAILIAHGAGVPVPVIAGALADFHSSFEDNPGRLNVADRHGVRVILDYAHNPAGLAALGGLIKALAPRHGCAIGCVSIPGDRRDEDIVGMGALAADLFDHIVFRERPDGRGRQPGEVMRLMRQGALEAGFDPKRLACISDETKAIGACLQKAVSGDLVVVLPTGVDAAWRQIQSWQPRHVQGLAEAQPHV